ncbi:MAG: glycosyltransferase family 39 protein [Candidatus Bathyarchaeota archaeon]|nr:glycosyltransferase family 39 protein [Candidatus Bathyarchaeota archaeon]
MDKFASAKKLEIAFVMVFSVVILAVFYFVISMNGVVLGNDPAVHLEKAKIFLETGQIPLSTVSWTPPLFELVLAMFISMGGASDIGQLIFMVKALTVIVNWLMFLSVYLIGAKFFSKKVGAVAAVLLLLCFPVFELNEWGGHTTVLGIAFLMLLLTYLPLSIERFGYLVTTFFAAFSVVLTHQLATFLAAFILPPVLLYMLIKTKGSSLKVLVALIFGGGIAFFLYYFQAMIGYLDILIEVLFFSIKTYAYQIPAVSFDSFVVNFGFILILAAAGFFLSFKILRARRQMLFFVVLFFSFIVPFIFAESYLFGFYLPFQWFIYYLTPPMAVLAAVTVAFLVQKIPGFYYKHRASFRRNWVRVATIALFILVVSVVVVRSNTVYGKILEAGTYYSTTDLKAYEAGLWLRDHYPQNSTIVVTEIPGFWFKEFTDKNVIAQTNPIVERNEIAESVLSLSYEVKHPQTLVRAYEAKGDISDENYVSLDHVWYRVSYSSANGNFLLYTLDGVDYRLPLSSLGKQVSFYGQSSPKKIELTYANDNVTLTETILVSNSSYPIDVSWKLTPLKNQIFNATLYLSTFFDLRFTFEEALIPGLTGWVNPWDAPETVRSTHGTGADPSDWAVATFTGADLTDNYLGLYDDKNEIGFGFRFSEPPDWGNVGALANRQIDAVRFQFEFAELGVNETASRSYSVLALAKNSYPALTRDGLEGLFSLKVPEFAVSTNDFRNYIQEYGIGFIVYDRNQLDTQMIHSKLLQLIYSNDRYAIFKIVNSNV